MHFIFRLSTIPQLYKCRWQVELFFKWIKQHLRIKHFFGLSPNAVKTQVWIAISAYVLVAIVQTRIEARPQPLRNPPNPQRSPCLKKHRIYRPSYNKPAHFTRTSCPNQLPLFDF